MDKIEKLLETDYWVVDILPRQVKQEEAGQFFAVEYYFMRKRIKRLCKRFATIMLKLNCYYDIFVNVNDELIENPAPEDLVKYLGKNGWQALMQETLFTYNKDDTYMTIYHPDEEMLDLIKQLAVGEGLYVWKPNN